MTARHGYSMTHQHSDNDRQHRVLAVDGVELSQLQPAVSWPLSQTCDINVTSQSTHLVKYTNNDLIGYNLHS